MDGCDYKNQYSTSQARAPRSRKLEKTLTSKPSKIEYKSFSAVELAGGRYRKPMYVHSHCLCCILIQAGIPVPWVCTLSPEIPSCQK